MTIFNNKLEPPKGRGRGRGRGAWTTNLIEVKGPGSPIVQEVSTPGTMLIKSNSSGRGRGILVKSGAVVQPKEPKELTDDNDSGIVAQNSDSFDSALSSSKLSIGAKSSFNESQLFSSPSNLSQQSFPVLGSSAKSDSLNSAESDVDVSSSASENDPSEGNYVVPLYCEDEEGGPVVQWMQNDMGVMPKRPLFGRRGKSVSLLANMFSIRIPNSLVFYRYDITVRIVNRGAVKPLSAPKCDRLEREQNAEKSYRVFQWLIDQHKAAFPNRFTLIYNRANILYSASRLNIDGKRSFTVNDMVDTRVRYMVEIKISEQPMLYVADFAASLTPELKQRDYESQTILDILFNQYLYYNYYLYNDGFIPAGRSFFEAKQQAVDLGCGRLLYNGFYKHHRAMVGNTLPTENGSYEIAVNIDSVSTGFYKEQSVVDFICQVLRLSEQDSYPLRLNEHERMKIRGELKGVIVQMPMPDTRYPTKTVTNQFTVQEVTKMSANMIKTNDPTNGRRISLIDFYYNQYGIELHFPDWPCFERTRGRQKNYVPMELCFVAPNQRVSHGRLKDEATKIMIRETAVPPEQRRLNIEKAMKSVDFMNDPFCQELGIKRSPTMVQFDARVLPQPQLEYLPQHSDVDFCQNKIEPVDGTWESLTQKFVAPAEIKGWHMFVLDRLENEGSKCLMKVIETSCEMKGMKFSETPVLNRFGQAYTLISDHFNRQVMAKDIIEAHVKQVVNANPDIDLLVFVVPDRDDALYMRIKYLTEFKYDVASQCIKIKNASLLSENFFSPRTRDHKRCITLANNVAMKINQKLGGVNVILAEDELIKKHLNVPVMFVGADVTHPPPMSREEKQLGIGGKEPSIASIVASIDNLPSAYSVVSQIQDPRQEMLESMKENAISLLEAYKQKTGDLPEKIIYYRDGVAEGQYLKVLTNEVQGFRDACAHFSENYQPRITYVVVTKRHHLRLFKQDEPGQYESKVKNVDAGTVTDSGPCHPTDFEFFLCSHQAVQGTSKPTKYTVLHDDNNFSPDDLQQLTYYLCFTYQRCDRSVSLPAPVYYAHLLAKRAKERRSGYMSECQGKTTKEIEQKMWQVTSSVGRKTGSRNFWL